MVEKRHQLAIDDSIQDDADEIVPFEYSITSYGADYTVDGLVKRVRDGNIYVPSFQRGYVWRLKDAARFVESLLLGLPVPGIFLSKEEDTQKLLVIDGQQRLLSLLYFYDGIFIPTGKVFKLEGVQEKFKGVTYKTLKDEDRRRLDDSILHATVVKQDQPSDDESSIYHIFERLNTGGMRLAAQEIRASIYHGEFSELLKEFNGQREWREIYGATSNTMRDQELILRFFALFFNSRDYKRPMSSFLNSYMGKNRHLNVNPVNELRDTFVNTIGIIRKCIGTPAFKPKRALNAAVFDAVMVGVARRLVSGRINNCMDLKQRYELLLTNNEFITASEKATADEENVNTRISLATQAFADVG
jgi:hypothetical protein